MIVFYRIPVIIAPPHNKLLPILDFASSLACQVLGRGLPIVESAIAVNPEGADDEVDQRLFRLAQDGGLVFPGDRPRTASAARFARHCRWPIGLVVSHERNTSMPVECTI